MRRALGTATELLLPLAVLAGGLALVVPWYPLADNSDLVLAALVLFTALAISPSQLIALRRRTSTLAALVLVPFFRLTPLAWLISRLFEVSVQDGVLALGVSSTEVAAVGLVALAGGSAVLALGALTGSLVLSALAGPPVLELLAGSGTNVQVGELVVRFALVVLLPLAAGLAIRELLPRLANREDELGGLAAIAVVVLVYAALSGTDTGADLPSALLASTLFLFVSAIPVLAWLYLAGKGVRLTGVFVIELRDFAVAAALATQAFGSAAASVAGVYGVLMLLLGAGARTAGAEHASMAAARCWIIDRPGGRLSSTGRGEIARSRVAGALAPRVGKPCNLDPSGALQVGKARMSRLTDPRRS